MKYDWAFGQDIYTDGQIHQINRMAGVLKTDLKDEPAPNVVKTAYVKPFKVNQFSPKLESFINASLEMNRMLFGFDLFQVTETDYINYNIYDSENQGEYDWHADGYKDCPQDIKLTAIINVSEQEYEGGDLELFINGNQVIYESRKPGTLIIFPSYIQHRVTPVTKGRRITISKWFTGPNWK